MFSLVVVLSVGVCHVDAQSNLKRVFFSYVLALAAYLRVCSHLSFDAGSITILLT